MRSAAGGRKEKPPGAKPQPRHGLVVSKHVKQYKAELAFLPIVVYTVNELLSRVQQKIGTLVRSPARN
ncbi:hypothetical protein TURU_055772 [Turdus rufiventris]|nr:hypothetical protein TURU_055772 [Turdus rufiventris]